MKAKKGKKGKPAVELRVALSSLQVVPGAKLKLDVSVKELTSSSWTKVVARLFERTVCREEGDAGAAAPPVWSVDRELANADLVRSSVYNFFLTDELIGTNATETKNADGETVTSEQLVFAVPRIPCSPLSSEHLDFSHFLRLEVYVPGWLSSDRSVYMDVPVQLMTCELSAATLLVNHNASIASIERGRHVESDEASIMSGKSGGSSSNHNNARPQSTRSTIERSIIMTAQSQPMTVGSLPPRYCDVHPTQRPAPTLVLLKHANASHDSAHDVVDQPLPQRLSRQSQSTTRHTTLSSVQSMEYKSLISGLSIADDMGEEKYRSRPLPTAPGSGPNGQGLVPPPLPPLPMAPMPDSMVPGVALFQSYPQASNSSPVSELPTPDTLNHGLIGGTPFATMTSDTSSPGSFSRKQRQSSAGSTGASATSSGAAHVRTPISPMHNDSMAVDGATSDDDAGYFKSSIARKSLEREKVFEKGMFRLRKNSSIKHTR
ncbi:hypothetical protein GGI20_005760 [Coemansia sp. BCRC 34301]|nr:hypothetical protein GGI20_005760 [Coemansia sp. BCRC 34301]